MVNDVVHHPRRKHCPAFNVVRLNVQGHIQLGTRGGIAESSFSTMPIASTEGIMTSPDQAASRSKVYVYV